MHFPHGSRGKRHQRADKHCTGTTPSRVAQPPTSPPSASWSHINKLILMCVLHQEKLIRFSSGSMLSPRALLFAMAFR